MRIPENYLERTYAGWLGKIIGIRLGAPIEGWTYQKIKDTYGEVHDYPVNYQDFAADDDSNGPLFFLRALEDCGKNGDLAAQDVGEALLNYAPFEHGFFWWGGYGTSTEHTAYLNLRAGINAPRSGSVEQNGTTIAEQIGGQIFIDTWGLVAPGNPDLAAKYAEAAASVTHGGNGIYGGIFIACAISIAYVEQDIHKIIEGALSHIPADCEYTRVVRAVMAYHEKNPENWRDCYQYIFENFGYDKYPGNCHIIPNSAIMILSMLYGNGDFTDTLNICNMCGWDTDCTVGNIGAIMGVRNGTEGIDYKKWREPINDFLACSSVLGSLNIMDVSYGASYIAKLAYQTAGETIPGLWKDIIENRIDSCHFEYPGSTHAIRVKGENPKQEYHLQNSDEAACTGSRSLKVLVKNLWASDPCKIYKKTYYRPADFHDSRYDPSFSPLIYPGQTVHGSVMIPQYSQQCVAALYVHDARSGETLCGEKITLQKGEWETLSFTIPAMEAALIDEAGVLLIPCDLNAGWGDTDFSVFIDDLYFDGKPDYSIDFKKENEEFWTGLHREVSQFTKLKGLIYLRDGQLNITCADFAEAYTGRHDWTDYTASFTVTPVLGKKHYANIRVQGAIRSYAAGFNGEGKFALLKNVNGYTVLQETDYDWTAGTEYTITVKAAGNQLQASVNGELLLEYTDQDKPYLQGAVGLSAHAGSHSKISGIVVQ